LLKDEQELVDKVKAVAEKRRNLPLGGLPGSSSACASAKLIVMAASMRVRISRATYAPTPC
jgi:hypothetical protein